MGSVAPFVYFNVSIVEAFRQPLTSPKRAKEEGYGKGTEKEKQGESRR